VNRRDGSRVNLLDAIKFLARADVLPVAQCHWGKVGTRSSETEGFQTFMKL